jgi:hypothetical protein
VIKWLGCAPWSCAEAWSHFQKDGAARRVVNCRRTDDDYLQSAWCMAWCMMQTRKHLFRLQNDELIYATTHSDDPLQGHVQASNMIHA